MDVFGNGQARDDFLRQNMMGPNAVTILREMLVSIPFPRGGRVLDLGCGMGLTSAFVASAYGAQVFAVDLWIPATENQRRFERLSLEGQVVPIHADAASLPFADGFFDAVVSVDAYHYFGGNPAYYDRCLRPLLKAGAAVAIAVVGLKQEMPAVPDEMKPWWDEPSFMTWHSAAWWEGIIRDKLEDLRVQEMSCFASAWADWLATDNPHAVADRGMMRADAGRYMNLVSITGRNGRRSG